MDLPDLLRSVFIGLAVAGTVGMFVCHALLGDKRRILKEAHRDTKAVHLLLTA